MMKLRRVYEMAEEEGRSVEEVALERFGNLEAFEEAKEERRLLDEREARKVEKGKGRDRDRKEGDRGRGSERKFMFTDVGGSGASSRSSSFRRPGDSTPSTPSPSGQAPNASNKRIDSLRLPTQATRSPLSQSHTPIPSVMTPSTSSSKRRLSPSSLNKLQAKVLRAKLLGTPDAAKLEKEYEAESKRTEAGFAGDDEEGTRVEVLPTLDGRGRLYDVGTGKDDGKDVLPGNKKKKEKVCDLRCVVIHVKLSIMLCAVRNPRSQNRGNRSLQRR